MKKLFLIIIIAYTAVLVPSYGYAQNASPSAEADQKVKKIIDLVASSVAEQKLVEKIGILGNVSDSTSTKLTLVDGKNQKRIVDIDEITKFTDGTSKSFGVSDIKKDDLLGIIGLLNKGSSHILARFISKVNSIPEYFDGVVIDVDKKNFTLNAVDENGKKRLINVETSTKVSSYDRDNGQIKAGFSKIAVGQRVFAAGFADSKIKDQLNADRLIYFKDVPPSKKMQTFVSVTDAVSPTVTPK